MRKNQKKAFDMGPLPAVLPVLAKKRIPFRGMESGWIMAAIIYMFICICVGIPFQFVNSFNSFSPSPTINKLGWRIPQKFIGQGYSDRSCGTLMPIRREKALGPGEIKFNRFK